MVVLYVILTAFVLLLAVLLGNAALASAKARKLEGQHPTFTEDELKVYGETFSRMLQCATVSSKEGHDDREFAKLRAVVEADFPLLHEKAQHMLLAEDCWIYKIPGKDESRNILFMSHHDVVPADTDWTMPAFEGIIKDGKVYGRGAADTKGSLCAILFGMEEMLKADISLGGEQSGHVIFREYATTGDGMLTALRVLETARRANASLDDLTRDLHIYPQRLYNVRVREKKPLTEMLAVEHEISACEKAMGTAGRVLVRFSGTEPRIRIFAEAPARQEADALVRTMADFAGLP
jgi:hypothetical protein